MFEAERIAGTDFEPNRLIEYLRPPFRKFEFSTLMGPDLAESALQDIVEPRKIFRWPSSATHRYFEGWVDGDRFKISRVISGQNSFLPIIQGSFRDEGGRTIVTLNLRMVWPVMIFWFSFMLVLIGIFGRADSSMPGGYGVQTTVPLGMMLFAYFMATVSFAIEVRIAMKRLLALLRSGEIRGDMR